LIEIKVFYWIIKAIVCGLFQVGDKKWRIAGKELISKSTFRLPDSAANDRFLGLRILKRVIKSLKVNSFEINKRNVLIFEANKKNCEETNDYIVEQKKYNKNCVICCFREELLIVKYKKVSIIFLMLFSFILLPITVFSIKRVQYSLLFTEFIEAIGLIRYINCVSPSILHYFNTSEKDSNFLYLIIKESTNLTIFKHPSPGALIAHNKNIMTDVLVLSSEYQCEEYNLKLKETVYCKKIEFWPPEYSNEYSIYFKNKPIKDDYLYLIGFYSHGGWLRKKQKLTKALFADPNDEEECLKIVSKYINSNNLILRLYLHPKEKNDIELAKKYYQSFIDESKLSYFNSKDRSSSDFDSVKIGVCAYSAILFERDNLGLKTLVWRDEKKQFPMYGTGLFKNSFNSFEEFNKLIETNK
jgi:hypothetical protein